MDIDTPTLRRKLYCIRDEVYEDLLYSNGISNDALRYCLFAVDINDESFLLKGAAKLCDDSL